MGVCDNDDPTDVDAGLLQIFQDIRLEDEVNQACIEVIDSDSDIQGDAKANAGPGSPGSSYTPSIRPRSPVMDDVEAVEEPAVLVMQDQDVEAPSDANNKTASNFYLLPWEDPAWPAFSSQTTKEPDHDFLHDDAQARKKDIPKSADAYDDDTTLMTLMQDARRNLPSTSSSSAISGVPREPTPRPPLNVAKAKANPPASNPTRIRGTASMFDQSTKWVGNWSFVLRKDMDVPWHSIPS